MTLLIHTAVLRTGEWFQAKTSLRENMQISQYYTPQQNSTLLAAYVWLCYCTALHPIPKQMAATYKYVQQTLTVSD